jgi:hypothetical protein
LEERSQMRTVWSLEQEASKRPSGDTLICRTHSRCPERVLTQYLTILRKVSVMDVHPKDTKTKSNSGHCTNWGVNEWTLTRLPLPRFLWFYHDWTRRENRP